MKKTTRKKTGPRLPLEAVRRLKRHPVISQKGEKGYNRKKLKEQNRKYGEENILEDFH